MKTAACLAGVCLGTSLRWTHGLPDKRMIDAIMMNHVSSPRGTSDIDGVTLFFTYFTSHELVSAYEAYRTENPL